MCCLLIVIISQSKEERSKHSNHLRLGGFNRKMLGLDCWLAKVSDHLIAGDSFVTAAAEWLLVTIFPRRSACGQVYNLFALNIICVHHKPHLDNCCNDYSVPLSPSHL